MFKSLKAFIANAVEFQSRIWVVDEFSGPHKGSAYVVNEDDFDAPLQWMRRKGYGQAELDKVDAMRRSQVVVVEFADISHRLVRVK
ncbi:hypothetical protein [Aliagarivorans marinus]|uniref:hypothetical protein n=1 Tax=Aliagarivorans marinus TaxID=561965 RepID=UPI00040D7832|nr:hypothetical protein [Aliagarivorans marinus]